MLAADKQALERELAQQLATLQGKELHALQRNFHNLAISCAVLIGFGFSGLGLFLNDDLYTAVPNPLHAGHATLDCTRRTACWQGDELEGAPLHRLGSWVRLQPRRTPFSLRVRPGDLGNAG